MNGFNLDLKVDNPEQRIVLSIQSSTEMHTKTSKNAFIAAMECARFIEWLEIPWAGSPGLDIASCTRILVWRYEIRPQLSSFNKYISGKVTSC